MPVQASKVKGVVDIVFLMDVTGSMQSCIDALKTNISSFVDTLGSTDANNGSPVKDWRAKVVGYRDFEEDAEPFVDHPFVRDIAGLRSQLDSLQASGGGDEPESLLDALYLVAGMEASADEQGLEEADKWRHKHHAARVVVIFTDATFKETMALPGHAGGTFEDVKNLVHANKVIVSLFAPELPIYDETLAAMDKAEYTAIPIAEGASAQDALAVFTADRANFRKTLEQLAKSVTKSASITIL
jgi:hypothetical protein